ncbi:MAG: hypothetical protein AAFX06_32530, partial [Planctomycetota bacterium]
MARRLRVLIVGRHFWPLGSFDSAGHLMDLAVGLQRHGMHLEIVTPRHGSGWSKQFTCREMAVHRPLQLFRTGWAARADRSVSRYIRDLTRWLIENGGGADVMLCDRAREESIAVVDACRKLGIPSVVRLGGHGASSDLTFLRDDRMGARCRNSTLTADAVLVNDASSHREWLASGASPSNVHRMTPCLVPPESTATQRASIRRSLGRVNRDLFVPADTTVLLSVERMNRDSGLQQLVESALRLASDTPSLQFWLIGDGPKRDSIYNRLRGDGLSQATAMPGSFGSMDD